MQISKKLGYLRVFFYPLIILFHLLNSLTKHNISKLTDKFLFYLNYFILAIKFFVAIKFKKNIYIEYDNQKNSFTYGEFFETIMFLKFLSCYSSNIFFSVIQRYSNLTISQYDLSEINKFSKFQKDCLSILNVSDVDIEISENKNEMKSKYKYLVSVDFCYLLPGILNLLIKMFRLKICDDFLLKSSEAETFNIPPYIAWHIRRNQLYDNHRNAEDIQILGDYRSLTSIFPNHKIMIFSTRDGIEHVQEILKNNLSLLEFVDLKYKIIIQPANTYLECIPYVVNSEFYFQRAGGGLGNLAIYSDTPFFIISHNYHYYFSKKRTIAAWNKSNQIYLHVNYKNRESYSLPLEIFYERYF